MMALGIGSSTCFRIASSGVDINGAVSSLLGISEKLEKYEVKDSHILWCYQGSESAISYSKLSTFYI